MTTAKVYVNDTSVIYGSKPGKPHKQVTIPDRLPELVSEVTSVREVLEGASGWCRNVYMGMDLHVVVSDRAWSQGGDHKRTCVSFPLKVPNSAFIKPETGTLHTEQQAYKYLNTEEGRNNFTSALETALNKNNIVAANGGSIKIYAVVMDEYCNKVMCDVTGTKKSCAEATLDFQQSQAAGALNDIGTKLIGKGYKIPAGGLRSLTRSAYTESFDFSQSMYGRGGYGYNLSAQPQANQPTERWGRAINDAGTQNTVILQRKVASQEIPTHTLDLKDIAKKRTVYGTSQSVSPGNRVDLIYSKYSNSAQREVLRDKIKALVRFDPSNVEKVCFDESLLSIMGEKGHWRVLEVLKPKIDVHAINDDGNTALHSACSKGEVQTIDKLLSWGGNLDQPNDDGKTSFDLLMENKHFDLAVKLKGAAAVQAYCVQQNELYRMAKGGKWKSLEKLSELGVDVTVANSDGNTALHAACSKGNKKTIEKLLSWGANLDSRNTDEYTPFDNLVEEGFYDIAMNVESVDNYVQEYHYEYRDNDGKPFICHPDNEGYSPLWGALEGRDPVTSTLRMMESANITHADLLAMKGYGKEEALAIYENNNESLKAKSNTLEVQEMTDKLSKAAIKQEESTKFRSKVEKRGNQHNR